MGSDQNMLFHADTAKEAMEKALYTLNLAKNDPTAEIKAIGKNGRVLFFDHNGETWSTMTDGSYHG